MVILKQVLLIMLFAFIILILFNILKSFVLSKFKVNKWIVFVLALVFFFIPVVFRDLTGGVLGTYVIPAIFVFLLLWFMDLSGFNKRATDRGASYGNRKKNKKNDVIKPKAKPNRANKEK